MGEINKFLHVFEAVMCSDRLETWIPSFLISWFVRSQPEQVLSTFETRGRIWKLVVKYLLIEKPSHHLISLLTCYRGKLYYEILKCQVMCCDGMLATWNWLVVLFSWYLRHLEQVDGVFEPHRVKVTCVLFFLFLKRVLSRKKKRKKRVKSG